MILRFKYLASINNSTKKELYNSIILELESLKVSYLIKTKDDIYFKNKYWEYGFFHGLMANIDRGFFKLREEQNKVVISYESYTSIIMDIALILTFFLFGIIVHSVFTFGSILLILQIFWRINVIKAGNKSLMNRIFTDATSRTSLDSQTIPNITVVCQGILEILFNKLPGLPSSLPPSSA